ncbi:MAG: hypothetical protein V9F00_09765 [Nocardioides sp.]
MVGITVGDAAMAGVTDGTGVMAGIMVGVGYGNGYYNGYNNGYYNGYWDGFYNGSYNGGNRGGYKYGPRTTMNSNVNIVRTRNRQMEVNNGNYRNMTSTPIQGNT